jgi:hypothetical protein
MNIKMNTPNKFVENLHSQNLQNSDLTIYFYCSNMLFENITICYILEVLLSQIHIFEYITSIQSNFLRLVIIYKGWKTLTKIYAQSYHDFVGWTSNFCLENIRDKNKGELLSILSLRRTPQYLHMWIFYE